MPAIKKGGTGRLIAIAALIFVGFVGVVSIIPSDEKETDSVAIVKDETEKDKLQQDIIRVAEGKKQGDIEQSEIQESDSSVNLESEDVEQKNLYSVVKVTDGDTIVVSINGQSEKLRLIGIDTPETVDPRKPVQCFGQEASKRAKELLNGKKVYLESDGSQDERDKYGRLLRYVILEDGTNFNEKMIREGYAHEYTYRIPYKYQKSFKAAEKEARDSQRGLWSDDTCAGDTSQSADSVSTTITAPKENVVPSGAFQCNCSKTCSQMSSCAEAQYQLNVCGCSRRDGDDDGIACDSQCQ